MNRLKFEKQTAVIGALVEGNSIRSTERMTGIHRDTIIRLACRVGEGCERLMDKSMRGLKCKDIQVDEIWSYVGKKQRHVTSEDDPTATGDFWTYVAMDRDTKLVPSYLTAKRNAASTQRFISDLASRMDSRIQLSSDALRYYAVSIEKSFGIGIDYGQIVKSYEAEPLGAGRYSPPRVVLAEIKPKVGNPDLDRICTSHVERQNLTMRMSMRRFTRLTNAFSKKVENLKAAVHIHFAYYNFVRVHKALRVTPAMEAGITDRLWTIKNLLEEATIS